MMWPGVILLLASASQVELVDDLYRIPPNEWRYVELGLKQMPVRVLCTYLVEGRTQPVRVALLRRQDMERMREGEPHGFIAETQPARGGQLVHSIRRPGDYVIVVDNREGERTAAVHLRISLDFRVGEGPAVTYLSPRRRLAVILISVAVFFGIVTWSARRLLGAVRR